MCVYVCVRVCVRVLSLDSSFVIVTIPNIKMSIEYYGIFMAVKMSF